LGDLLRRVDFYHHQNHGKESTEQKPEEIDAMKKTPQPQPAEIWAFQPERRIYPKPAPGQKQSQFAAPIWREHWVKTKIVGQSPRNWIGEYGSKYAKADQGIRWVHTEKEVNDLAWVNDNAHKIAECVRRLKDAQSMREIARILGYSEA
jgi:hypothetical protein